MFLFNVFGCISAAGCFIFASFGSKHTECRPGPSALGKGGCLVPSQSVLSKALQASEMVSIAVAVLWVVGQRDVS